MYYLKLIFCFLMSNPVSLLNENLFLINQNAYIISFKGNIKACL